ncbi:MAG: membrane protein insertase YidC [Nitrospirae bacterium]|nr:membrane protein insertase YidC [Candidatus Manganitrophaceae bacterium]
MEKRLIVFLILSLGIIFAYPYFLERMGGPTKPAPEVLKEVPTRTPIEEPTSPQPRSSAETPPVSEVKAKEKVIESDLYRVVLSNVGGVIKEWQLKKYIKKDPSGERAPIELVPKEAKTFPLTLISPEEPVGSRQIYTLDERPTELNPQKPQEVVTLSFVGADGHKIQKSLTFHHDSYLVDLQVTREGYSQPYDLSLGTNFGIEDWGQEIGGSVGSISLVNGEVFKEKESKITDSVTHEGALAWTGMQDKYFLSALVVRGPDQPSTAIVKKEGEKQIRVDLKLPSAQADQKNLALYAGPKEYDRLASLGVHLEESIDFGWFIVGSWLPVRLVAKPLFYIIRFFYQFSHNYGVAIILVTVLVKVLFFPVTRKSLVSMKEMAAVQPKINAIRKKHAADRTRMNQELMNLYKEHKINPVGGCLPMLVQIPVFVALFNILYNTIDLRQAPFILWIHDLSDKDPYYILPIIMGVSMFFQQLTQPTTMDPTQAKVMLFLPVIYTFFFLNFPSGLVLYWLVNNLLSIGQQYLMKREGLTLQRGGNEAT